MYLWGVAHAKERAVLRNPHDKLAPVGQSSATNLSSFAPVIVALELLLAFAASPADQSYVETACWCVNAKPDITISDYVPGVPTDNLSDDLRRKRIRKLVICGTGSALFLDYSGESPIAREGQLPDSVVAIANASIMSLTERGPFPVPPGPEGVADWFPGRRLVFALRDTLYRSYRSVGDSASEHLCDRLLAYANNFRPVQATMIRYRQVNFGGQPVLEIHARRPDFDTLDIEGIFGERMVCGENAEKLRNWLGRQHKALFNGLDGKFHQISVLEFSN